MLPDISRADPNHSSSTSGPIETNIICKSKAALITGIVLTTLVTLIGIFALLASFHQLPSSLSFMSGLAQVGNCRQ